MRSNELSASPVQAWLTLMAIIGTLSVNLWFNRFPLNRLSIGDISNTLFANVQVIPANYAFAIWGLIYLGLMALGVYQLLPPQRHSPKLNPARRFLIFACVAQAVWVVLFLQRQFVLSVVAMLAILLPLIGMYLQLGIGQHQVSRQERWLLHRPISLYLGWITVATVVNVASALYSIGWSGWGISSLGWAIAMVIVSGVVAAVVILRRQDVTYGLVIAWALAAIAIRQSAEPLLMATSVGIVLILTGLLLWQSTRK